MSDEGKLSVELRRWVEDTCRCVVSHSERIAGGGRRHGYRIDLADGRELFLTVEVESGVATLPTISMRSEATLMTALHEAGIPSPCVVGVRADGRAILATRVRGTAAYARVSDAEIKLAVAQDFMRCLAGLHALDPAAVGIPEFEPTGTVREHLEHYIERWEHVYRDSCHSPDPLVEFGLAWLKENLPDPVAAPVIVQGDTGPGNFLFDGSTVTAILDWELAHLGDPLEDLAWLSMRAAQEPFTELADRIAEYGHDTGLHIDLHRLRYYRVLAEWSIALVGHLKPTSGLGDSERGNAIVYEQLHRRLTIEAIAEAESIELPEVSTPRPRDTARTWMYDMALDQLRESVVPRISDPLAARRAKGVARTLRILRDADRLGGRDVQQEIESLAHILGLPLTSESDADGLRSTLAARIRSGDINSRAVLAHLWTAVSLDNERMRPAMGRFADQHLADLAQSGRLHEQVREARLQ